MAYHAVPLLLKSSNPRLMFVARGISSMDETIAPDMLLLIQCINASPEARWTKPPESHRITAYRSAKAGLNMLIRDWARLLKNDGGNVWAIAPGFLVIGLAGIGQEKLRMMGAAEPRLSGELIRDVVQGSRDGDIEKIVGNDAMIQPW